MPSSQTPLRAADTAVFRPLGEGGVVLDLETGDYYELNVSGRFLWDQLAEGNSREGMIGALRDRYDLDEGTASDDVDAFIDGLQRRRLLET